MNELHKDSDGAQDMYQDDPFEMRRMFFEVMCGTTTGEANVIVRSTAD